MTVDAGFADWLRAKAVYAQATDATVLATWGVDATESEIISPLALKDDALAEAARQIALWGGRPVVVDTHIVPGQRRDLYLRTVTLQIARLGYDAGIDCLVLGYAEGETTTQLAVLRRL